MALKPGVTAALMSIETTQEVREAWDTLKQIHSALKAKEAAGAIAAGVVKVGAKVTFRARHGRTVVGTVEKINRTTAIVVPEGGGQFDRWRVGIAALKAVAA